MKDNETISQQPHELAYAAKELGVPAWLVLKSIEDIGTNKRSEVYEYIRKQLEAPVDAYSIVESLSKQTGLKGVRKSIILRAIEDLGTTDEGKIKQHLANEMWSYVDSANYIYQSAELNDEQKEELLKAFKEQPWQFMNTPMRNKVNVIQWAKEKGILDKATPMSQAIKTLEEVQELLKAINDGNETEMFDAYGGILVTIIIGAKLSDFDIEDCLEMAYKTIKDRTGRMENGTFIKD